MRGDVLEQPSCAGSKLYNLNQPHHQSESYRKSKQPQNYRHGDLLVDADSCSARVHCVESHGSARSITGNLPSPLEFQHDRLAVTAACPSTQARVQIITGICRDSLDQGKKEARPPNDSTNKGSTEVVPVLRLAWEATDCPSGQPFGRLSLNWGNSQVLRSGDVITSTFWVAVTLPVVGRLRPSDRS
jgi:hypothetical protein